MTHRTHGQLLPASLKRLACSIARKQSLIAVWTIIAALLIQQSAIARISLSPAHGGRSSDSVLTEAGSVFIDSNSGTMVVRVTDSRDGLAMLAARVDSSSFNLDSSRFFVNLDGVPTLYSFNPSSLATQKQGLLFGSIPLQFDSCHWSAAEADTVIGLDSADSARLYAYDTRTGSYTLLKDFSDILPKGEAQHLSKSWSDDNRFAFSLRLPGSAWRFGVVWDRSTDSIYLFDAADSIAGVTGFNEARLDRAGEALIVKGDVTRVWRYRTQQQSEAVQLESTGDSGALKAESQVNDAVDLAASISHLSNLPQNDVSRDGRFSIFPSHTDGRSDVFIATMNVAVAASSITWTHMANCTAAANSLQKTAGVDRADDAHATSTQAVMSGDAYVEFTAEQSNKERWCGLNNTNAIHQSAADINFAIKLGNNTKANVVENGVVKAKIKYKQGSVFRVALESGVVNYYKNGSVFYTSTASPAYPLLVNASLVDAMAAVTNAMIYVTSIGVVVSISPARASATAGTNSQFTALVTGSNDTITWSATAGSVTNTGMYNAPAVAGTYTVKAACTSNPNINASATISVTTTAGDTTPPVISAVNASSATASGVTISWNTDEPSDTQVEYGPTVGYGALSTRNPAMVTSHSVAFGGLAPNTTYHFRVRSSDAAGNPGVSGDFTFTTLNAADTTPPVISGVSASSITTSSATIAWNANEASDTQAEYGTTAGYGSSTALNASMVTSHSAFVSWLSPSATYHYRVKSRDAAGNLAVSGDFTFTTSAAPPPPPPASGVITDHNVYPEPAPPALPRAGSTFVDPTFGTTIMRVTDENDGTSNFNYYSYWPTFNLNSTWFFIACDNNPKLYRFDPNNFQIISKGPLFDQTLPGGGFMSTEDGEWSGSNPTLLYGYYGLKLWSFDVSSRVYTLIKDFTGQLPPGYLGQMSRSLDDNMFAFTVKDPSYAPTGYIVWQRDQDKILRNVSLSNFDEVEVDKTGRYLAVKAQFAGGVDFQAVDLQTGTVQGLTDPTPDFSPGHSDNGRQIVVGHDDWNNQYTIRSFATPHQFRTVIAFGSDWSQANHLSMLADDESRCVISNFTNGSAPVGPFRQEIFQASTDGSQSVRRLAHHHSVYRDYWDTPRANISRDGRFVAFTSNWGSTSRRDVFIIKVPQGSGTGTGDTTPPVISGVSASGLTSSGATISWTTNEASDSQVEYGTSSAYGSGTSLSASMVTGHSANISGASPNTLYHYRVRSKDAAGNLSASGDFTLTTAGGTGGGSIQNVVWTSTVNCTVSGNSVQKSAGRDDTSDAGAVSQQQIVSGDGYVEFTAGAIGKIRFCGLTHSFSGTDFFAIDFGIKLTELGAAEIRENNSYQGETTYTGSDVFRIAIVGGVVKYSKNGVVFYTSGKAPAYPLLADATFLNLAGTVNNAVISAASGGSLAVSLREGRGADLADTRGQIIEAKDLLVEVSSEWKVGVIFPPSLRRVFARS